MRFFGKEEEEFLKYTSKKKLGTIDLPFGGLVPNAPKEAKEAYEKYRKMKKEQYEKGIFV